MVGGNPFVHSSIPVDFIKTCIVEMVIISTIVMIKVVEIVCPWGRFHGQSLCQCSQESCKIVAVGILISVSDVSGDNTEASSLLRCLSCH